MNINKEMRLRQWAQDMAEQQASGLTQKRWCDMKGIGSTTFEYRCRKVKAALAEKLQENQNHATAIVPAEGQPVPDAEPIFAKVNLSAPASPSSGVNIRLAHAEISIAPDTPAEHVRMVLEVLARAQ